MKKYFFFICLVIFLSACQSNEEQPLADQETDNKMLQVKNSDPTERTKLSNQEIAKHLARVANRVPNVNEATALIAGPYAVVGIDVDKELDRSRVGTIKYAVNEALHDDPYGKTAVVIADADGTERIKNMAKGFQEGHPIQNIIEELSAIVGRYMPETPPAEIDTNDSDTNKDNLSKEEKKDLDKIQEEQSNQHMNKNGE
ncbi:Sporulation lipoprotein YhcN/YlaJ (Spore_YhcN_YlaJ) [Paraliobacillus sp. PM-2]|uniref:YhcN/YlaJ family sporulation lipoprotein n=1 Tax=Paraliobacillus sp. PM-2 TaxID=1462524 RepID=UPI00061C786E|nr:YhcN/YlaJ family sporulation lipoprotein [Paraliobacillus sp. PM-2]CQR47824.1 Sporulation lipoprotein YhcN/YlaJ (Spore_YhcN_YlaJ) [Paraliobacillus sp. PM-2]